MKNKIHYLAIFTLLLFTFLFACSKTESNEDDNPTGDSPCVPSGLKNNTLAFYTFGSGSLKDVSGNGHDLTNPTTASPGMDRSNNSRCAYQFSAKGTSQEFLTNANAGFLNGLSQFSISMWYKPTDSSRKGGDYEILIGRDSAINYTTATYWTWHVALYDCRKAVFGRQTSVWDQNATTWPSTGNFCDSEIYFRTGSWHHLVATFDRNNNQEMKLYRDGVLQQTASGTPTSTPVIDTGGLFLGRMYSGSIDDVIIFNKTLTQTEVSDLAAMGSCCEVD